MRGRLAPDATIARRAARQGGVISHAQLTRIGLSADAIERRARAGHLHRLHRGVYAVGHTLLGPEGRWWTAVLALGADACLSHHSAAHALGMRQSASGLVHVTVRGRTGRKPPHRVTVHRPLQLPSDEATSLRGLPMTTPARTLLDLAAAGVPKLDTILDRAEHQRLIDFAELHALLERYPRRPGTRSLKAQLARYRGPIDARSALERLVHQLCHDHGLPPPQVNCSIEGRARDFYRPHCRLVVETDS
jgi:predicted transcriptional regulator of viral defense system